MSLTEDDLKKMHGLGRQGIQLVLKGQEAIRREMAKSTSVSGRKSSDHAPYDLLEEKHD